MTRFVSLNYHDWVIGIFRDVCFEIGNFSKSAGVMECVCGIDWIYFGIATGIVALKKVSALRAHDEQDERSSAAGTYGGILILANGTTLLASIQRDQVNMRRLKSYDWRIVIWRSILPKKSS